MAAFIIYPIEDGVAVVASAGLLPIAEVARKDVPAGVPYLVVDQTDVPTDPEEFASWQPDFTAPDGHGIGAEAWFAEQAEKQFDA